MESRRIDVDRKGGKAKFVPIPKHLASVLTDDLATVRPKLPPSGLRIANPRSTGQGHHKGSLVPHQATFARFTSSRSVLS